MTQGAMGRIADAWKVLRGAAELADDARYIRRDEVPSLVAQLAEMEVAIGSTLEKVNAMAARLRKREQRAAQDSPGGANGDPSTIDPPQVDKAALRRSYGLQKLATRGRVLNSGD